MSNLIEHAKTELKYAKADEGFYGDMVSPAVLELIEVFSKQGHSGGSAPLILSIFTKLAKFQPLAPLTGEDDEWFDHGGELGFQNKRCSHVFKKSKDAQAYDINAIVWEDEDGMTFTNSESRQFIEFPYWPKTEYRKIATPNQQDKE